MSGIFGGLIAKTSALDVQTVTTSSDGDPIDFNLSRGFVQGGFRGTCVDGTSNIYSDALILRLEWRQDPGDYIFNVNGSVPNSGWTTLTIVGPNGTKVLTRASASYNASASTAWVWPTADDYLTQAFGDTGDIVVCTFT
jgi:hypothetical protein